MEGFERGALVFGTEGSALLENANYTFFDTKRKVIKSAKADVKADPTNTVMWYQGADSADARASVQAKVDDAQTVSYGAQANEAGTLNLVRSLAVLSIQNFSTSDATSDGRFDAIASRNMDRMSAAHNADPGSIQLLTVELGTAKTSVAATQSRHDDYNNQLQSMLDGVENSSDEEVASEMLALQTRLQATYQATSMIANLSLVNYLK